MTFARELKKIRSKLNFTQQEMASYLTNLINQTYDVQVSYYTYLSWEQGKSEPAKTRFRPFGTVEILNLLKGRLK